MGRAAPDADVFVSYARADGELVAPLAAALEGAGVSIWMDQHGIPVGSRWLDEINQAITRCRIVVCLLSPNYLQSANCLHELDFAREYGKRVLPVLVDGRLEEVKAQLPDWVGAIQWHIAGDHAGGTAKQIIAASAADPDWVKQHTSLLLRAKDWEEHGKKRHRLLKGRDIETAEEGLTVTRSPEEPRPTELQRDFVVASQRARTRQMRATIVAVAVVASVSVAGAAWAVVERRAADVEREEARVQRDVAGRETQRAEFTRISKESETAATLRTAATAAIEAYEIGTSAGLLEEETLVPLALLGSRTNDPVVEFAARPNVYNGSGDAQGVAISGDGSTLAFLDPMGSLTVVSLFDLSTLQVVSGFAAPGAFDQLALDVGGQLLVHVSSERLDTEPAEAERWRATTRVIDLGGSELDVVATDAVDAAGAMLAAAVNSSRDVTMVSTRGEVIVTDFSATPPEHESLTIPRTATLGAIADEPGSVTFSADAEFVCLGGALTGYYNVAPLELISSSTTLGCVPGPCGGSTTNFFRTLETDRQWGTTEITCVYPDGRAVAATVECRHCALARGTEHEGQIPILSGAPPGGWHGDANAYVVPGAAGAHLITTDPYGRVAIRFHSRTGAREVSGRSIAEPADLSWLTPDDVYESLWRAEPLSSADLELRLGPPPNGGTWCTSEAKPHAVAVVECFDGSPDVLHTFTASEDGFRHTGSNSFSFNGEFSDVSVSADGRRASVSTGLAWAVMVDGSWVSPADTMIELETWRYGFRFVVVSDDGRWLILTGERLGMEETGTELYLVTPRELVGVGEISYPEAGSWGAYLDSFPGSDLRLKLVEHATDRAVLQDFALDPSALLADACVLLDGGLPLPSSCPARSPRRNPDPVLTSGQAAETTAACVRQTEPVPADGTREPEQLLDAVVRFDLYPTVPMVLANHAPVPAGVEVLEAGPYTLDDTVGDRWWGILRCVSETDAAAFTHSMLCGNGWLGGRRNSGNWRGYAQLDDGGWWEISLSVGTVADARVGGSDIPPEVPDDALRLGGLIRQTDVRNVNSEPCSLQPEDPDPVATTEVTSTAPPTTIAPTTTQPAVVSASGPECVDVAWKSAIDEGEASGVWKGDVVKAFQQRLVDLGYGESIFESGGVDGEFGDGTLRAFYMYANWLVIREAPDESADLWMYVTATSYSGDTPYGLSAEGLRFMGVDCR